MSHGYLLCLQERVLPNPLRALPTAAGHRWGADANAALHSYSSTTVKEISSRHLVALVSLHDTEDWICVLQLGIRPARFWISNRRSVPNPALKMAFGLSRAVFAYSCRIVGIYLCICFLSLSGRKHLKIRLFSLRHTIGHLWVLQSMPVWKTRGLSWQISIHTAIWHQLTEFLALHLCFTYKCDNTKVCVYVDT